MKNCRILKQMQLCMFMDLDDFYQHAIEMIAQTYDEHRCVGKQNGMSF